MVVHTVAHGLLIPSIRNSVDGSITIEALLMPIAFRAVWKENPVELKLSSFFLLLPTAVEPAEKHCATQEAELFTSDNKAFCSDKQ